MASKVNQNPVPAAFVPSFLQKEVVTIPERPKTENFIIRPRYSEIGDTFYPDQAKGKNIQRYDQNNDSKIDKIVKQEKYVLPNQTDSIKYTTEKYDKNFNGKPDFMIGYTKDGITVNMEIGEN